MRPQRQNEDALVLEGEVIVTPDGGGAPVEIKAGDYCTFPKGMSCTWEVSGMVHPSYKDRGPRPFCGAMSSRVDLACRQKRRLVHAKRDFFQKECESVRMSGASAAAIQFCCC